MLNLTWPAVVVHKTVCFVILYFATLNIYLLNIGVAKLHNLCFVNCIKVTALTRRFASRRMYVRYTGIVKLVELMSLSAFRVCVL